MKYYSILRLLSYNYPNLICYLTVLLFITIILLLYWYISVTLREVEFKFSLLFGKSAYKRFDMKDRGEYLNVSLFYKLYSVPFTIMESIFYFVLVILTIFLLRVMRLGTTIDSYEILYKINNSTIITKLLYLIIIICYISLLKQYLGTFSSRLYYTLRKLYIYLLQVGGLYDIVNYREGHPKDSYVGLYFKRPIINLHRFMTSLYNVYKPTVLYDPNHHAHKKAKTLYEFYITRQSYRIAEILVPLFYFVQLSEYKNTRFVKLLKVILDKLCDHRWIVLYSFPIIVLLLTIFYEYFYKDGILSNIYNILLIIFAYKIYLDLMYFFEDGSISSNNELLCIYYYVCEKLDPRFNKDAMTTVLSQYAALTRKDKEHELNLYLENHLNGDKLREIKFPEEYISGKITIRLKNFLIRLKIVTYVLSFMNAFLDYYYDKDSFALSKKVFIATLCPISNMTKWLLSKELIGILTLICIFSTAFFPKQFLPLLYIPLVMIYVIKIILSEKHNYNKSVLLCYSVLIIAIYTFYTKHYNIFYMDEIVWNYGTEITQDFTIKEKAKYFKDYLNYLIYAETPNMTSQEKRDFLALINFDHISEFISNNTKLCDLKQLALDYLELYDKIKYVSRKEFFTGKPTTAVIVEKKLEYRDYAVRSIKKMIDYLASLYSKYVK